MNTHGGKRAGAGRKPMTEEKKKVQVTIYLKPETKEMLKDLSKDNEPMGDLIERLVNEHLQKLESGKI